MFFYPDIEEFDEAEIRNAAASFWNEPNWMELDQIEEEFDDEPTDPLYALILES